MMHRAISAILLITPLALTACATNPRPYGSSGPGESWIIVDQDDPDMDEVVERAKKQRAWGWKSHLVTTSADDAVKTFSAGPFAYAGEDPGSIEVSILLFADPPVTGQVIFQATPQAGQTLQSNWQEPLVFPVTMVKGWHSEKLILPQLQGPTESVHIEWITEAPTDSSRLKIPSKKD